MNQTKKEAQYAELELLQEKVDAALTMEIAISQGIDGIMTSSLANSKKYITPKYPNLFTAHTKKDLLSSFFLRSYVYRLSGYDSEFTNATSGLDYDPYDAQSVTIIYKVKQEIVASCRMVLDGKKGLPSDKYCKADLDLRRDKGEIVEFSRLVISPKYQKSFGILYILLMAGSEFARLNGDMEIVYCAGHDIVDLYERKYIRNTILNEDISYGKVNEPMILASYKAKDVRDSFHSTFEQVLSRTKPT